MKNYTETKTWKAWQKALGDFPPNEDVSKMLFSLLLGAHSLTNLEKLADQLGENEIIPETCRLSVDLKRSLKQVWSVMTKSKEQWVIISASLEGLGLGLGFASYYWKILRQGRPVVKYDKSAVVFMPDDHFPYDTEYFLQFSRVSATRYVEEKEPTPIDLLMIEKHARNTIYSELEVSIPDPSIFYAKLDFESVDDQHSRFRVKFFYGGVGKIWMVIFLDILLFTEKLLLLFPERMPPYSIFSPGGHEEEYKPAICYRFNFSETEMRRLIEIGEFLRLHKGSQSPRSYQKNYVDPKPGFLEAMQAKLKEVGIPLADSLRIV
jgi:hypothetical protein